MANRNTPSNFIDLSGTKIARLTVLKRLPDKQRWRTRWLCRCSCGTYVRVTTHDLRSGNTKSCGCLGDDILRKNRQSHKKSGTSEYMSWCAAKGRCSNKNNAAYEDYGGRGITMCKRWK